VAGSFQQGNESSNFKKCRQFLTSWAAISLSRTKQSMDLVTIYDTLCYSNPLPKGRLR